MWIRTLGSLLTVTVLAAALALAGTPDRGSLGAYKVLAPISSGNLTIYPVVTSHTFNTSQFLTLDGGLRNGSVVVTEREQIRPLIRGNVSGMRREQQADVNSLVLFNNSNRPLLLLAGEIVTGGKQDRVVGSDRIVPAHSGPIDLGVFCVEPGRWTGEARFDSNSGFTPMAQPSVRKPAMAEQDQQEVWNNVRSSQQNLGRGLSPRAQAGVISGTTSYAKVMQNDEVANNVDKLSRPIQQDYERIMRDLRDRHAVGVVVAVDGRIIWADIFASTELLQAYWPKLIRSYAAEALAGSYPIPVESSAQAFIEHLSGEREVIETEPGVYRRSEVSGLGFKVFSLTSLVGKYEYEVHLAKMADSGRVAYSAVRQRR